MEKPVVLKQRFRWNRWQNIAVVLVMGLWVWQYSRDSTAALIWLPALFILFGNVFSMRVVLASDRITIYDMAIYGELHRFERIVCYAVTEGKSQVNVEVTLEQKAGHSIALWGTEISLGWRRNPTLSSNKERIVSFFVEPEQLQSLLNYLRAQGAVVDEIAAMWTTDHLAKRARLLRERDDLSDEEAAEMLREIEEQLMRLQKY